MQNRKNKWSIKRLVREILILAVIVFIVSTVMNMYRSPQLDSNALPEIKATLIDNSIFDSSQATDKPLLINFWGTWCPVCAQEASNIESVSKKYRVITIAVNSGSDEKIKKWLSEHKVNYPVINDTSGKWAAQFKVSVYPTIFIYDSKGKLKFTETGYSTTLGLLARMKLAE